MCTSALSGKSYMQETLDGHPRICYNTFRMAKHVFLHLCNELKRLHLLEEDTGIVSVQESIGILLYILGHNADIRLTGNRFQHSLETIQRRLRRALRAFHSLGCLIIRPDQEASELPNHLRENTKYYPLFEKCVGASDGIHISAHAPGCKSTAHRDRCCDISQNVICACNFDMRFTYVHASWEGSAHDSRVMQEAIVDPGFQFPWPPRGSYYLVNSGYAIGSTFLPLHKSVRYHAQEFRGSARQPTTPQELFNYRHSSLRMVIERCFGVLKARFPPLVLRHSKPCCFWTVVDMIKGKTPEEIRKTLTSRMTSPEE
uniref:DDE Tnp4 domain-containing protein n=2 Tax=Quercus lobata TaxID=97700 RepID=A0A7N2KNV2_QUELO